jgi:hypothetical protein
MIIKVCRSRQFLRCFRLSEELRYNYVIAARLLLLLLLKLYLSKSEKKKIKIIQQKIKCLT